MKYKIAFGVIIPLFAIIALAIIASSGEIEVEKNFPPLSISKMFQDGKIKTSIELGNLKLSNKNSFTKRYEIPQMMVCLHDKENIKQAMDAGTLEFNRGDSAYYKDPYRLGSYSYKSIEVKSEEEVFVKFFIIPGYQFTRNGTYEYLAEQYAEYDEVVIFEKPKNGIYSYSYTTCHSINDDILDEAIKIKLVA